MNFTRRLSVCFFDFASLDLTKMMKQIYIHTSHRGHIYFDSCSAGEGRIWEGVLKGTQMDRGAGLFVLVVR